MVGRQEGKTALNPLARACRAFTSYPTRIDESGKCAPQ